MNHKKYIFAIKNINYNGIQLFLKLIVINVMKKTLFHVECAIFAIIITVLNVKHHHLLGFAQKRKFMIFIWVTKIITAFLAEKNILNTCLKTKILLFIYAKIVFKNKALKNNGNHKFIFLK